MNEQEKIQQLGTAPAVDTQITSTSDAPRIPPEVQEAGVSSTHPTTQVQGTVEVFQSQTPAHADHIQPAKDHVAPETIMGEKIHFIPPDPVAVDKKNNSLLGILLIGLKGLFRGPSAKEIDRIEHVRMGAKP